MDDNDLEYFMEEVVRQSALFMTPLTKPIPMPMLEENRKNASTEDFGLSVSMQHAVSRT